MEFLKDDNNIIHIDMDAFFASVEEKYNPELKNKPIGICGKISDRGVLSTANYIARKYGVHSAMPVKIAKKLCPQIILIEGNFELYKKESYEFEKICAQYTPDYEKASIDEIYLDVSKSHLLFGDTETIAKNIKKEIKDKLNLTCSIGISYNKILAKIASDINKPNGFTIINKENTENILNPLPIEKIPGVGKKSKEILNSRHIYTIADLRKLSRIELYKMLGTYGEKLFFIIRGLDDSKVIPENEYVEKSISNEITLEYDTTDKRIIEKIFITLVEKVSNRLQQKGWKGKTIKIKIKYFDFKSITRQLTLQKPTDKVSIFYKNGLPILDSLIIRPIRLIGFGVSNLYGIEKDKSQLYLFK